MNLIAMEMLDVCPSLIMRWLTIAFMGGPWWTFV
jgi:hypothetical protein